jgi:concentrative nucleoside transporter, CNT family
MYQLMSFLGIFVFIAVAYGFSRHRSLVNWKLVAQALILQTLLALLVLGVPSMGFNGPLAFIFAGANDAILRVLTFSDEGSRFLFGSLMDTNKHGFIVALSVLPTIIFVSSLMSVLYYIGLMQWVVRFFAWIMYKTLKVSGAEALASAANIFVGQTEAPLVIKPFLKNATHSEMFSIMVGGMATVAGGVLAAYVGFLKDLIPNIGGHLLTASIISAPAAIMIAKILMPETETPETLGSLPKELDETHCNVIEAAATGASDGVSLAINVGGMLLAFIALISLADYLLISLGHTIHFSEWAPTTSGTPSELSMTWVMSWAFSPISFFMGIPWEDIGGISAILGKKTVFNEFVAYLDLAKNASQFTPRSLIIASYALCGFANFSSIAIQIGGIGGLVPGRKRELAQIGILAVVGGSLASFITACFAGMLIQ